jgi:hypothetical protein
MKYGVNDRSIEFTASKMAMCIIAKLRPPLMVGGCAPGIRRSCRSISFHLMTSCPDTAPSSSVAAETCRGTVPLKHARMTINARSRRLTPRLGEDGLTRGVVRSTRLKYGEVRWVQIPCQNCHCVKRIGWLLSCYGAPHRLRDFSLLPEPFTRGNPSPRARIMPWRSRSHGPSVHASFRLGRGAEMAIMWPPKLAITTR